MPSECGLEWFVIVLSMQKIMHISLNTFDSKLDPWSEWICKGTPKIETILSPNVSATVLASASGIGIAYIYFAK